MDSTQTWEYMHARAALTHPARVSFYEERHTRLYSNVNLTTIGSHGWELVSVVMVPNDEGILRYEYFFKRPVGVTQTILDKQ